jgi:hypothetical protein
MNSAHAVFGLWPSTAGSVRRPIRPTTDPSQRHCTGARAAVTVLWPRAWQRGGVLTDGASMAGTSVCLHGEHDDGMRKALDKRVEAGAHPIGLTMVRCWRRLQQWHARTVDDERQLTRSGEWSCSSREDRGTSRVTELRKRGGHKGSSSRREESGGVRPKQATWAGLWQSPASRRGQKARVGWGGRVH